SRTASRRRSTPSGRAWSNASGRVGRLCRPRKLALWHRDAALGLQLVAVLLQARQRLAQADQLAVGVELLTGERRQLIAVGLAGRDQAHDPLLDPLRAQLEVQGVRITLREHVLDLVRDLHAAVVGAFEGDAKTLVKVSCVLIHVRSEGSGAVLNRHYVVGSGSGNYFAMGDGALTTFRL